LLKGKTFTSNGLAFQSTGEEWAMASEAKVKPDLPEKSSSPTGPRTRGGGKEDPEEEGRVGKDP